MIEGPLGGAAAEAVAELSGAELGQPRLGDGDEPGGPRPGEHEAREKKPPAKPTARILTITIVLATFVAALGGFLLNRASAAASNADDLAQELSLQASAAETSAYQQAESDYAQYLSLQALKAKAAQEMLEATYDQEGTLNWADQYKVTAAQVEKTARAVPSDLRPSLANGDPDPNFPYDFFAKRASTGTYLEAKSDAYNDVSDKWSGLVDSYTAILTMIAVALFLFGSAYVLYGRNRMGFTVLGALLVGTGLVWGGALAIVREPGTPSDAAARDYANAVTAMDRATVPAGYQVAIDDFTRAIRLRPDFALAYSERAEAEAFRGSEAVGGGFVSGTNVSPHWLRKVDLDEIKAYELGEHDPSQLINVGFGYYTLWFLNGADGRAPGVVARFFRQAVESDPTNPVALLDLGLANLASGQYQAATQAYTAAVTHMLFTCSAPSRLATCNKPQPQTSYGLQQAWLGGAMDSLETLAQTREARASVVLRTAIVRMRGLLTASMATGRVVAGPGKQVLKVPGLSGFLDPNYLELDVPVPPGTSAFKMAHMPLTVLWYQRPVGASQWSAISETACWGHGEEDCGSYNSSDNSFEFTTRLLAADDECFTNVEYRAELYVGGSLAGSLSLSPKSDFIATNLTPALSEAMNVGVCVPSTWRLQPTTQLTSPVYGTSTTVSGPLSTSEVSYASAGHKEGVYLFRLYPLRTLPDGTEASMQSVVRATAAAAIDVLKGHGLPSDIAPEGGWSSTAIWGPAVADMNVHGYASASTGTEAFVGAAVIAPGGTLPGAAAQDNSIAADVTSDYAVVVTVVYGRANSGLWSGPHSLGLQVFTSWSLLGYG